MYIRTQDKETLSEFKRYYVDVKFDYDNKKKELFVLRTDVLGVTHDGSRIGLGTYPTKARCIEVIDAIESAITNGLTVFHMPLE